MLKRMGQVVILGVLVQAAGCFRDLDFAPCQEDPSNPICFDAPAETDGNVIDDSAIESGDDVAESDPPDEGNDSSTDTEATDGAFDGRVADSPLEASADSGSSDSVVDVAGDAPSDVLAETTSDAGSCAAGSFRCVGAGGGQLEKCATDGKSYSSVGVCPSAATCSASLGRCTACTPSSYSCVGTARQQCNALGSSSVAVATCATPELCAASSGAVCAGAVCAAGEKSCSGKTARTCNAGRTAWIDSPCEVGCSAGSCITIGELAGSFRSSFYLARMSDGTVRCWGASNAGECGAGKRNVSLPTTITGLALATQVSAGNGSASALHADGTASWWGKPPVSSPAADSPPAKIPGLTTALEVRVGGVVACARFAAGVIKCWGGGNDYSLGSGSTAASYAPSFVTVAIPPAASLEVGYLNVFALVGGEARGWGYDLNGQVGVDGGGGDVTMPTAVFGYAAQISASQEFTCAALTTGQVKCAGLNSKGQLGDGTKTSRSTPVAVTGLTSAKQVAAGWAHACAVTSSGGVACWGANNKGQLGDGTTVDSTSPVSLPLTGVHAVAAAFDSTCALDNDLVTIRCWGDNAAGQLGAGLDPATYPSKLTPVKVAW